MLPPTTAIDVQMVCPKVAPVATPTAFLWVANCIEDHASSSVTKLDEKETAGKSNLKREIEPYRYCSYLTSVTPLRQEGQHK